MGLGMRFDTPPPPADDDIEGVNDTMDDEDIEIIEEIDIEEDEHIFNEPEVPPPPDHSKVTFRGHSNSVFCCAFDSSLQHAATGGEDDKGFLWNPDTAEIILECTDHADSVIALGFNHDSSLLATGDMSGVINVWNVQNKVKVCNFSTPSDLRWLEWHHSSNVLIAGAAEGDCWMWRVPDGMTKTFQSFGDETSYGHIMPDGKRYVVGYADGSIRFWDLKNATVTQNVVGSCAHSGTVITIDCHQDNVLVATGSLDGTAKLIKSTNGKVIGTMVCSEEASSAPAASSSSSDDCVECVSFFPSHSLLATSTILGVLDIWDVPTQVRRHRCKLESGIIKHICSKDTPMVFTGDLGGNISLYDGRSGQFERKWQGHTAEILDFNLSSDGSTIITASEDETSRIFKVNQS